MILVYLKPRPLMLKLFSTKWNLNLSAACQFYCGKSLENAHSGSRYISNLLKCWMLKSLPKIYKRISFHNDIADLAKRIYDDKVFHFSNKNLQIFHLAGFISFDDKDK